MSKTKMSARERMESLLDESSFVEVGTYVTSRNTDFNMNASKNPGDGVITGYGVVDGRLVYVYSQDYAVLGGSIGEMHAKKIEHIYELAMKVGAPVIGLIDCAGLRLQESVDGLGSFGKLFQMMSLASGSIMQLSGVFGTCGGGAGLIPTLTDLTVMEKENGALFVNSPNTLDGSSKEKLDTSSSDFQKENVSSVDFVEEDELAVLGRLRQLVAMLPANFEDNSYFEDCTDDLNRIIPELDAYEEDAASIFTLIADNQVFVQCKKDYAKDIVTGFIRLNGATVGCVGNQCTESKGALSSKAAYKAAEFVKLCDAFSIPVLSVSNASSFKATVHEEKTIAKAAAKLTYAFASATVPKVNLLVGKSFGTPYIAMNSKSIGADIEFAWPDAKVGMMDAKEAVKIMYADEIAKSEDKVAFIAEKASEYEQLQSSAMAAAKRGYVDDIIEPDATRKRVIAAFEMLFTKQDNVPAKKHGTV